MTYYNDLTNDDKRVSIFKEAIIEKAHGLTYDLGTGSGILAEIASKYSEKVYAFEINPLVIKRYTKGNLEGIENVSIIQADASTHTFEEIPDVVICEMLDTALIDEEQVLVINNILDYTKEDTIFIPKLTYDTIQVGFSNISHIVYLEEGRPSFKTYSNEIKYNQVDFSEKINPYFDKDIEINIIQSGTINSILITTYTYVTEELFTGPTPMLNPPLVIPVNETEVNEGDIIKLNLKYIMGGGLNTITANIE